jgi:uncharacterized protein YrrD
MPTLKELLKKPIYRLTDGVKLGEIKDLFLDAEATRVVAVLVGKEGVFARKTMVLRRDDIEVLGVDAWLATGSAEVANLEELPGGEGLEPAGDYRKRELETVGNTKIGTVGDVIFDDAGNVTGFALGKVLLKGAIADSGQIARPAVSALGDKRSPMLVDLESAEKAANRPS